MQVTGGYGGRGGQRAGKKYEDGKEKNRKMITGKLIRHINKHTHKVVDR